MVRLVLEDTSVPTGCFNDSRHTVFVKALDPDCLRTGDYRCKTGKAQARFKKINVRLSKRGKSGIDQYVKLNRTSIASNEFFGRQMLRIFRQVFHYCQLNGYPDLGSSQSYTWRIPKRVSHRGNQLLDCCAAYFLQRNLTARFTQGRFSDLHQF